MIEVVQIGDQWTWTMICPGGRVLVYTPARFDCNLEAFADAKAYRLAVWAIADLIDHRQARAI